MAEATIPVDLRNPGQVFACLGLMEAAEILFPESEFPDRTVFGRYDWSSRTTAASFILDVEGVTFNPLHAITDFILHAKASALNAPLSGGGGVRFTAGRHLETQPFDSERPEVFPFNPPKSAATLPARLSLARKSLTIGYWGDDGQVGRENVKLWGGSRGKLGPVDEVDSPPARCVIQGCLLEVGFGSGRCVGGGVGDHRAAVAA